MIMDSHAEIKDECDGLENRLDDIATDIRDLPFHYRLVDKYTIIDEKLQEIYEWYNSMKSVIRRYEAEKEVITNKIDELSVAIRLLNNEVQNLKLQAFSHGRHGGSYSQLPDTQRP